MRLAEAIRLGTMQWPRQAFGRFERFKRRFWFFGRYERALCALGTAYAANNRGTVTQVATEDTVGFRGTIKAGDQITMMITPVEWMPFFNAMLVCPKCHALMPGKQLIPHMNDDHRMTREAIAVFVERVENAMTDLQVEAASVAEMVVVEA